MSLQRYKLCHISLAFNGAMKSHMLNVAAAITVVLVWRLIRWAADGMAEREDRGKWPHETWREEDLDVVSQREDSWKR